MIQILHEVTKEKRNISLRHEKSNDLSSDFQALANRTGQSPKILLYQKKKT